MNLCFRNLRIMNLCTSARESWTTRLCEKLNKIHVWINFVRSQGTQDVAFTRVQFSKFFSGGTCPRTPLYNSCIRGWQSACFSNNLVLNVQLQKISMPKQNEWWYQVWMKQKFEHQRIQNVTKSIGDQKSSWIMNLNSCRNHESLRRKRQKSWMISRFKWFRFYPRPWVLWFPLYCSA